MIVLTTNRNRSLVAELERASRATTSYSEVGLTRAVALPSGYRHDTVRSALGTGEEVWERAKEALGTWVPHRHAGIDVFPPGAEQEEGATVVLNKSAGPMTVLAPCRVVYRTDEATRVGFAYGTLPGHPEKGEEAFHVVLAADGVVAVELVAFSRPSEALARLAGPLAREVQKAVTRRYVEGVRRYSAR